MVRRVSLIAHKATSETRLTIEEPPGQRPVLRQLTSGVKEVDSIEGDLTMHFRTRLRRLVFRGCSSALRLTGRNSHPIARAAGDAALALSAEQAPPLLDRCA